MVLKHIVPALIGAALLAAGSAAMGDEYRPDEFLSLDLSKAVLSPKPLGPPTQFAPVAVEAKGDRSSVVHWAREELKAEPKRVAVQNVRVTPQRRIAQATGVKPRGAARAKLAPRRGNPLNAQAMDTRIQTWPCKSGGICNWKQ